MPRHMFRLTMDAMKRIGLDPPGSKVSILGWAFLSNTDDTRNTPSEPYRDLLMAEGCRVVVHDAWVCEYPGVPVVADIEKSVKDTDAVVIFAGHNQYRNLYPVLIKKLSGKKHPIIVDGRNMVDPDAFIREGFVYKGIGRGDKNGHAIVE